MKFFTRSWASGDLPDQEVEEVINRYWGRIDEIEPQLPPRLATLARKISLHDGLIHHVNVDLPEANLTLDLVCGDLQIGYFDLRLQYRCVDWSSVDRKILARRALDEETEVLYDEVDRLADGSYEHRLLFWPEDEVAFRFSNFDFQQKPRPARDFERPTQVYLESGDFG